MKCIDLKLPIALGLTLLLVQLPVLGTNAPVGKVIPRRGATLLNGTELKLQTTLFAGDTVATQAESLALILLSQGDQVHLGPATAAALSEYGEELVVSLERGMTLARSGNGRQVSVNALGLLVRPSGMATYEVAIDGKVVVVVSQQGSVEVQGTNRSIMVPSGKAMKFGVVAAPEGSLPVGAGAHNLSPGAALGWALAVSLGVTLAIVLPILLNEIDDAKEEGCQAALNEVSPAAVIGTCPSF